MGLFKFYFPLNYGDKNYYYGRKKEEVLKSCNVTSYFIVKCTKEEEKETNLELLGSKPDSRGYFNIKQDNGVITDVKIEGEETNKQIMIFFYDPGRLSNFNSLDYKESSIDDNFMLFLCKSLQDQTNISSSQQHNSGSSAFYKSMSTLSYVISLIFKPMMPILRNTAIYQHSRMWKRGLNERRLRSGAIVFDIMLGVLVCLLMTHIKNPENYFMSLTDFVVDKLHMLLDELAGSPAGLKLNVQLNNFLHKCFIYHVDLWWNFIEIVEPAIRYLFIPITLFGLMGFSFQCAMLCDIIAVITLHANCFYIYAAMLYKLEITSLKSLWRIVIGRRLNVLKNRVESQEYSNRQLFIAMMFFTTLLFLVPTVLVYYIVFASLRLFIYCITYALMSIQRGVLMFPFFSYVQWIFGHHFDPTNITFDLISYEKKELSDLYQFKINIQTTAPWKSSPFKIKFEDDFSKPLGLDAFVKNLFKGELMSFLPFV